MTFNQNEWERKGGVGWGGHNATIHNVSQTYKEAF